MKRLWGAAGLAAIAAAAPAQTQTTQTTQAQAPQTEQAQVDDIVVTGRRSGVPQWTVRSETTTIVLLGAIQGVTRTTKWDPEALTEALRKADRVVFPESRGFTASPFSLIGWAAKYNAMGSLPKGQHLSDFASPDDMRRLAALAARGLVRKDYDTRHPLHLAGDLREHANEGIKFGQSPVAYVRHAIKEYKLEQVPLERSKAKPLVQDLFASTPQDHLPCLHASIALAEAGGAEIEARSQAWAARKVTTVLRSPVNAAGSSCWPAEAVAVPGEGLTEGMKRLLAEPRITVAVLTLSALAEPGGVLDGLEAAGYDIRGPRWKD
jgi:uncharacterized protein YbaP (TraB family)